MSAEAYRWRCSCCGEEQIGLPMAMGFEGPRPWEYFDDAKQAESFLNSDFCKIVRLNGEIERYVLGILILPVPEIDAEFQFAVWVSVSERSWDIYSAGYGAGEYKAEGCFGFLANAVPGYGGSSGLHADVWFQPDGLRPLIALHDGDHPLISAQKDGVDLAQVEQWAASIHRNASG